MRTIIALIMIAAGVWITITDSIELPESAEHQKTSIRINVVKTTNDDLVVVPRVIASVHEDFVRYGLFLPADDYLLAVSGAGVPVELQPVVVENSFERLVVEDDYSLFALDDVATGPAPEPESDDGNWDYYFDVPTNPQSIAIGRYRLRLSLDSARLGDWLDRYPNQIELTDIRLTALMNRPGATFENIGEQSSDRRLNIPVNLDNYSGANERDVIFRSNLGRVASTAGSLMLGLGAGYFLGSIGRRKALHDHQPEED